MLKPIIPALAAVSLFTAAACSQGPNEEAGEALDTAAEEAAAGAADPGQGPMEEQGEQLDNAIENAPPATEPAPAPTTP